MSEISFRFSDREEELDWKLYHEAMEEHQEKNQAISFEEMVKELGDTE